MELQNLSKHLFSDSQPQKYKYPLSGGVVFEDGTIWDQNTLDHVDRLEHERKNGSSDLLENRLHKTMFADRKAISGLKVNIKTYKKILNSLLLKEREAKNDGNDFKLEWVQRHQRNMRVALLNMEAVANNWRLSNGKGTKYIDADKMKEVSITDYIDFNRAGRANCLWHDDSDPSMKYYPHNNRVHCFSCNIGGDVIDVIQKLNDCNFNKALQILSGNPT